MRTVAGLVASLMVALTAAAQAADVTIGYQLVYGPWKARMAELKANGLGGKSIEFVRFTSGSEVINAMASGSVDISLSGSSPTAAGYSRGVDMQVIYVYDNINDAEALVVDDSITAPQDLVGKTVAVPFGSTTHFHLMFALEQFNIPPKALRVLDMSPPDMVAAWERGDINGGFVWDPALGRMKERGRVLLTSGDLSNWGQGHVRRHGGPQGLHRRQSPVYLPLGQDGLVRRRRLSQPVRPRMVRAPTMRPPLPRVSPAIPTRWAAYWPCTIIQALEEQVSSTWLGGGVQNALRAASEFLVSQGKLDGVLDDYTDSATAQIRADGAGRRLLKGRRARCPAGTFRLSTDAPPHDRSRQRQSRDHGISRRGPHGRGQGA